MSDATRDDSEEFPNGGFDNVLENKVKFAAEINNYNLCLTPLVNNTFL
jgi:hypothetical protein